MGPPHAVERPNMHELRAHVFPAMTWHTCMRHYIPMTGAISHSLFALHLMKPSVLAKYVCVCVCVCTQ
jgi:hypothetical protein